MFGCSDGVLYCSCFFSGDAATYDVFFGEESGKLRINIPMMVSLIGDLSAVVILQPLYGMDGEIFCFHPSSSTVAVASVGGE